MIQDLYFIIYVEIALGETISLNIVFPLSLFVIYVTAVPHIGKVMSGIQGRVTPTQVLAGMHCVHQGRNFIKENTGTMKKQTGAKLGKA